MWTILRPMTIALICLAALASEGCRAAPNAHLQQSLVRTRELYSQSQSLAAERDGYAQSLGQMAAERQSLEQQNQALRANLDVATKRLDNIQASNDQLEQHYKNLLTSARTGDNPLPDSAIERFKELQRKYPDFEFDPQTGVSKFHSDLLFASGSDAVRPDGAAVLREFAAIMNRSDTQELHVLCVGHTDDRPISRANTRNEHPTNWHLSTDRANAVVLALKQNGVMEHRLGAAGYSMVQPVAANNDETGRQQNRRVEIYVLAPDAAVAGWEPGRRN